MKVLAYTSPARGHLYPVVPIMAELVRRGHQTAVCTLSDELEHLAPLGIHGSGVAPALERSRLGDWRSRSAPAALMAVVRTFVERAGHEAPDLRSAIVRHEPDVLLVDVNCWGAAMVAEACELPWAMYSPYLLPISSRDAPPFGLGLAPRNGRWGKVRDRGVQRLGDVTLGRHVVRALNPLRARHGLSALARLEDVFARPPLLLALTAEGFEYPRSDWPANVRLMGPMNWGPPRPAPEWLAETPDPLVLVTCSTEHQQDARLVETALNALPAQGVSVVATTAAHDPGAFTAPRGSRVVGFLPHEPLLERAACAVCHGGMGIAQKALAAGVPLVVVPFGRDQLETARRVELAGAGVRLPARWLTPERLADAVCTAMTMHPGAERVSRLFAAAGGPAAAAEAVEEIAAPPDAGLERADDSL